MASVNKVIIVGNLGRDPEQKYLPSGDEISNISVATTYKAKDKEYTEWHRIVAFGKLAEIMNKYLVRGSQIYLEGRLQTRKWTDKDGIERYSTEIIGEHMQMLGGKPGGRQQQEDDDAGYQEPPSRPQPSRQLPPQQASRPAPRPAPNFSDMDDDIPF